MKAAELIVKCLVNEGVGYVFGIPGEENMDVVDALVGSSIQFVTTRHEQGAAFMADVYGRLTGQAGVCLATDEPVPVPESPTTAAISVPATAPVQLCSNTGSAPKCYGERKDLKAARKAFAQGLKLEQEQSLDEALYEFQEAARLVPQNV